MHQLLVNFNPDSLIGPDKRFAGTDYSSNSVPAD
jgi:hypothetical protein